MNRILLMLLCIGIWIALSYGCTRTKKDTTVGPDIPLTSPYPAENRDERPVIVAFGNSLTAGSGVEPDKNYPSKLQARIDAAGYSYRVVNSGVSGDTSSQGLNRIQSVVVLRPSIVIVELGANDGLRGLPAEATRQNLAAIISRLQSAGATVILAGMQMPPNYGPQYTNAFRTLFKDLSKQYQALLIPFFLEGVGGHAELNQEDGIHPTAEGYDIVVQNVWKVLQPLLR